VDDLINKIKNSWENKEELTKLLVEVCELYNQTTVELGITIQEFATAMINEKENTYKTSVAEIEYRIKSQVGNQTEVLRGRLQCLTLLHQTVSQRVDDLSIPPIPSAS